MGGHWIDTLELPRIDDEPARSTRDGRGSREVSGRGQKGGK